MIRNDVAAVFTQGLTVAGFIKFIFSSWLHKQMVIKSAVGQIADHY